MSGVCACPQRDQSIAMRKGDGFTRLGSSRRRELLVLFGIIVLQVCLMVYAGFQRQDMHTDEVYSYVIANSTQADRFSHADWLQDTWVHGEDFDSLTTVHPGDELNLAAAYHNTSLDSHPPLYYWALHLVCALFQGPLNWWVGIGLNIAFFIGAELFVFLASRELIGPGVLSFAPVAAYGFSAFAVGTVEFIRMYMLLTLWAALYTWLTVRIMMRGFSARRVVVAAVVLYAGVMTQYYFAFYAFWLTLVVVLRFFSKGEAKHAVIMGLSSIAAIALLLITFPAAIAQATGSPTNNVGNEVSRSLFDVGLWLAQTKSLARETALGITYSDDLSRIAFGAAAVMACVSCLALIVLRNRVGDDNRKRLSVALVLAACWLLTFLTVAKVGGDYVYLRYIYFIIPFAFLILFTFVCVAGSLFPGRACMAVDVCCFILVIGLFGANCTVMGGSDDLPYMYAQGGKNVSAVAAYDSSPLVILYKDSPNVVLTNNYTTMRRFDRVFAGTEDDAISAGVFDDALETKASCVLYIPKSTYWTDGFDSEEVLAKIRLSHPGLRATVVNSREFGDYYVLSD